MSAPTPSVVPAVSCSVPDPASAKEAAVDGQEFSHSLVAALLPMSFVSVLGVFVCVYLCATFTRFRCDRCRRWLRAADTRRDPESTITKLGQPIKQRATTAGGCSFLVVVSVAVVKGLLDLNSGLSSRSCSASLTPTVVAGLETSTDPSDVPGVPDALSALRVVHQYVFAASTFEVGDAQPAVLPTCNELLRNGSAFRSHFPAASAAGWAAPDVPEDAWEGGAYIGPFKCVRDSGAFSSSVIVSVAQPTPMSYQFFGGADRGVQYALTGDCVDLEAMQREQPQLSALRICTQVTRPSRSGVDFVGAVAATLPGANIEAHALPKDNVAVDVQDFSRAETAFFGVAASPCTNYKLSTSSHGQTPRAIPGLYSLSRVQSLSSVGRPLGTGVLQRCLTHLEAPFVPQWAPANITVEVFAPGGGVLWPACPVHDVTTGRLTPIPPFLLRSIVPMPGSLAAIGVSAFDSVDITCPSLSAIVLGAISGAGGMRKLLWNLLMRVDLRLRFACAAAATSSHLGAPHSTILARHTQSCFIRCCACFWWQYASAPSCRPWPDACAGVPG